MKFKNYSLFGLSPTASLLVTLALTLVMAF